MRIITSVIGRAQRSIGRAQLNIGRASALPGLYKTTPVCKGRTPKGLNPRADAGEGLFFYPHFTFFAISQ